MSHSLEELLRIVDDMSPDDILNEIHSMERRTEMLRKLHAVIVNGQITPIDPPKSTKGFKRDSPGQTVIVDNPKNILQEEDLKRLEREVIRPPSDIPEVTHDPVPMSLKARRAADFVRANGPSTGAAILEAIGAPRGSQTYIFNKAGLVKDERTKLFKLIHNHG